ncbi:PREDICTED: uncharacterized protein LOC104719372 [Camelina sativa]|uniref:Uncharacterized protein LOC104719372 n=1 Tax=Camelina sativa TaxID=90675 RepID=A0ABM0U498_CAMSA|nr:PREDICTED: uncharacterized protein LOC104719372 [Camelina sativa]
MLTCSLVDFVFDFCLSISAPPGHRTCSRQRNTMTTIHGSDNLAWSDEQTRFYLQLRIDEKLKGNIRKQNLNDAGRQSIIDKFYEAYGERHPWKKFGIKFTTCKKQYKSFRKLTHNRTGLGYHSNGSINMSDDWWNERCKEWSGARKIRNKPVANVDLMEKLFGTVHISGAEGSTAQQGEEHQDDDLGVDVESSQNPPTQDADSDDDDAESRQIPSRNIGNGPSYSNVGNGPSSSSRSRGSKKRLRSVQSEEIVAEVIRDSGQSRDKILAHWNQLIESHPEISCSQLRAMKGLHSLPGIRMWSPLYKASIQHLKQDIANRETFLFYEDDENKILYLEFATGESRDA